MTTISMQLDLASKAHDTASATARATAERDARGRFAREGHLAAMDPDQRAVALSQERMRLYNPGVTRPLGSPDEASDLLQKWLHGSGIRMADSAYVTKHPNPGAEMSNSGRGPDGEPMVALHPERWDYGTLAHETAHLLHSQAAGGQSGASASHGPEFQAQYARLLNQVAKGAGNDLLDDIQEQRNAAVDTGT